LEIGAQWAIAKKDVDMFERYMAQLKCYYLDYRFEYIFLSYSGKLGWFIPIGSLCTWRSANGTQPNFAKQ